MLVSSTDEFQAFMFEQLHFLPEMNGNYTCYSCCFAHKTQNFFV